MLILDSPRLVTRAQGVPSFLPTHTMIQENKDGSLKIGHVRLDPTGKNIAFPAEINMRKGQLEYALTGPLGKLHESLLKTKTLPVNIHLAMLLLGIGAKPQDIEDGKQNPEGHIEVSVHWTKGEQKYEAHLNDWIFNIETGMPLESLPWIYNGARMLDGQFTVHREQSYIAIIKDEDALVNSSHPDHQKDDIWEAHTGSIPSIGTKVSVKLQLIRKASNPQ